MKALLYGHITPTFNGLIWLYDLTGKYGDTTGADGIGTIMPKSGKITGLCAIMEYPCGGATPITVQIINQSSGLNITVSMPFSSNQATDFVSTFLFNQGDKLAWTIKSDSDSNPNFAQVSSLIELN